MKSLKVLFLAAGLFVSTLAMAAPNDETTGSHLFFGVQGGAQTTFTNGDNSKLIMPFSAVQFGGYYNPVIGARLHAMGWRSKGVINSANYYYNYYTANADLLMNLSNLLWKNDNHVVNLVLLGGVGLNYMWHNNDMIGIVKANPALVDVVDAKKNVLGHNFRLGLQLDFNLTKHVGVNLEVAANSLTDRFNSKINNDCDWMLTGAVGISYKFGFKKKPVPAPAPQPVAAPAPKPAPVAKPEPKPEPAPAPKPAPVVVKEKKTLEENIFYEIRSSVIRKSEIVKVERIANFMKQYPEAKVDIVGYADKGTGNSNINKKYSQNRANDLKKLLNEKYGIALDRISATAKGDSVQPFAENDKNRVTIITSVAEVEVTK